MSIIVFDGKHQIQCAGCSYNYKMQSANPRIQIPWLIVLSLILVVSCTKGRPNQSNPRCAPLPVDRPEYFEIRLSYRGGEPESAQQWGIAARSCQFEEIFHAFPDKPRHCMPVDAQTLDAIYSDFREHHFSQILNRELVQFSPHRGGWGLTVYWHEEHCEVFDSLMFEVARESKFDFDFLVAEVRKILSEHQDRAYSVNRFGLRIE